MDPLEQGELGAALAAALERAARQGDWAAAKALGEELGARAWGRRSLMGESPEGLAFERALRGMGEPEPLDWINKQGGDPQRRARLEARLAKALAQGEAEGGGGRAGAWLAAVAGPEPERDELSSLSEVDHFDAEPWAARMAQRVRAGELGRSWSDNDHFWRLAQKALRGEGGEELFSSLERAKMARPFKAAASGAGDMARRLMGKLSAPKALALLAAASCQTPSDWPEFEEACGHEAGDAWAAMEGLSIQDGEGWKALAASAAGAGVGDSFESRGGGSHWGGELSRGSRDMGPSSGWTQALEACAAVAAPALEDARVSGALEWIAKKVPATAAAKAAPALSARGDLSHLDASEVLEALGRLSSAGSAALETASRSAAARLWALRDEPGGGTGSARHRHDESTPLAEAAEQLWRGGSPKALEAFLTELESLCGSKASLADLTGLPQRLRWARALPGAPGNVVALLRVFGPGRQDERGVNPWMDSSGDGSDALSTVGGSCATAGRLALIESGGGSGPAPKRWSGLEDLSGVDLSQPRWLAGQGARAAEEGWELAGEALVLMGRALGVASASMRPPSPDEGVGASRNAWACFAEGWPEEVAQTLASEWIKGGPKARLADEMSSWLSAPGRFAVGKAAPKAFMEEAERASKSALGSEEGDGPLARACRQGAKALWPKAPEELCAAAMCAAAVGLAEGAQYRVDGTRRNARAAATGLAEYLPLASATASRRWEGAGEGFLGPDLGARAARAALELKASGMVEGPLQHGMDEWAGVALDRSSPWTAGVLGGLFTEAAWEVGDGRPNLPLWRSAFEWAKESGAGLGREPGGASALELAVDARAGKIQSARARGDDPETRAGAARTFGEQAIQALVVLGADPSDPEAGQGWDALALCSRLERSQSPSSAMKALLASPKAKPGRGALWSRLGRGKANFSPKLEDTLLGAARDGAELGALGLLGARLGVGRVDDELRRTLAGSPAARALAPELLGEMARQRASSESCEKAAEIMEKEGLEPSMESRLAMGKSAARELDKDSPWGLEAAWRRWSKAGAALPKLSEASLPQDLWSAWEALGFKTEPGLGEMACAAALWQIEQSGHRGSVAAQRAGMLALGALALSPELAGKRLGPAMARVWDAWERHGHLVAVRKELGEAKLARLEACALSGHAPLREDGPVAARGPRL